MFLDFVEIRRPEDSNRMLLRIDRACFQRRIQFRQGQWDGIGAEQLKSLDVHRIRRRPDLQSLYVVGAIYRVFAAANHPKPDLHESQSLKVKRQKLFKKRISDFTV